MAAVAQEHPVEKPFSLWREDLITASCRRPILAAAAGGLSADLLIRKLDPSPTRPGAVRIIAIVTPLVLWFVYFGVIIWIYDLHWPTDLWLGTVGLAGFTGALLSFLSVPPAVGGTVWEDDPGADAVADA
jgi:hypothetical protein